MQTKGFLEEKQGVLPALIIIDAEGALHDDSGLEIHNQIQFRLSILEVGDLGYSSESRKLGYFTAQPYVTCGSPQLRGCAKRETANTRSTTIGILPDAEVTDAALHMQPHFAAKQAFHPCWPHPIAKELQEFGAPIIGGTSGTLGRNIFMLAPLVAAGLLSYEELLQYCMGFWADLVYRGHHSYEEIALVFSQLVKPLKSWLDPIRSPKEFYEQLLAPEFLQSKEYRMFSTQHQNFFNESISEYKLQC